MKNKIQATLGKLTTLLAEEEYSKEIMHTQNVKFRKFMFRLGNYNNTVLTPAEVISLHDATANEDMGEKFFKDLVEKLIGVKKWKIL